MSTTELDGYHILQDCPIWQRNRDTSYGRRMSQLRTSYGKRQKTCVAPPNPWQHADWESKHGWSIAEEEEDGYHVQTYNLCTEKHLYDDGYDDIHWSTIAMTALFPSPLLVHPRTLNRETDEEREGKAREKMVDWTWRVQQPCAPDQWSKRQDRLAS